MKRQLFNHLDPVAKRFVQKLERENGPPLYELTPAEARRVLVQLQEETTPESRVAVALADDPNVTSQDQSIPAGPLGCVHLRIYRDRSIEHNVLPAVIMYFHGGGWILGDAFTHDRLMRELAAGTGAVIVFVDYDRAPEYQYPVQIQEAYAATAYVVDHANEYGIDPSRVALAGDSVGGNMATVVALLCKEFQGPRIRSQALFYPVTDARFNTSSYKEFANGPWLTRKTMQWFWDAYLPDKARRSHPTASPLRAPLSLLRGLPPTLLLTDENDVLRDEGEAYGRKLARAGVYVTFVRYFNVTHDFLMLNALADAAPTRQALQQGIAFLRRTLRR